MARYRQSKAAPTSNQVKRFIEHYVFREDLEWAAKSVRITIAQARSLYNTPKHRNEIERKIGLIETEKAKLEAQARQMTVDVLDGALMEEVKNKKGGAVRVRAIELGYKRTGMIRDGEFFVPTAPSTPEQNSPKIYQAARTTTLRRTTTEEVIHSQPTEPRVLEAVPVQAEKNLLPEMIVVEY